MIELVEKLDELDLAQYLDRLLEQGFDTWATILDITEPDLVIMGVKLGHRRKLQRRIAAARGTRHVQALASPKRSSCGLDDKLLDESKGVATSRSHGKDGSFSMQPSKKRKYMRHPKQDPNAPARPRSAYVIFSNKMREDLKDKSLSFTEFTKVVGRKWQCLTPSEKEPHEHQSFTERETFTIELAGYITTESYKTYSGYLLDFKDRQLRTQQSNQQPLNVTSKVPRLQNATAPADRPCTTLMGFSNTMIGANAQTLAWSSQARSEDIPIPEDSQQKRRNASLSEILN
ncbi:hypothetical protein V493_00446 [Pseudogymnoascus sp. VKM F-4281 (FW-2241)]|nr:hypothetical protein V493_00446 [Pseudogymnoascus sp. VKM F-4281 (FW-2241)]